MANKKLTDFNLSTSLQSGDFLIGYKANASSELRTTFQTLQDSLPSLFKYQGTDLKALSANWEATYTSYQANSGTWDETTTFVKANSAIWETDSSIDTELRDLSGNWQDTCSIVQSNSASWAIDTFIDTGLRDLSGNWNEAFSIVQANSATWEIDNSIDTELRDLSGNWQDTFSTVQTNSASNWDNAAANQYSHSNFLPLSGGDLTGMISLSNVAVDPGQTITDCLSCLVITINGQQFKVPLLAI